MGPYRIVLSGTYDPNSGEYSDALVMCRVLKNGRRLVATVSRAGRDSALSAARAQLRAMRKAGGL